jgi:hypothetical protein
VDPIEVIELRQYLLRPGARDRLIELFEREFIETQEAVGISVIGHFRDVNDPNRFVWLRGFPSMPARQTSLEAFYFGAHWKSHRNAANATLIDNDNVLLLRPATSSAGFDEVRMARPTIGSPPSDQLLVATIYYLDAPVEADFIAFFDQHVVPALQAANARVLASLVTDYHANTFPALPVREGEHVFVSLARHESTAAYDAHRAALARSDAWAELSQKLALRLRYRAPELLVLSPCARSLLPRP